MTVYMRNGRSLNIFLYSHLSKSLRRKLCQMFRGRLLQVRVVQVGEGLSGDGLQWHDGGQFVGFEPRHHNAEVSDKGGWRRFPLQRCLGYSWPNDQWRDMARRGSQ